MTDVKKAHQVAVADATRAAIGLTKPSRERPIGVVSGPPSARAQLMSPADLPYGDRLMRGEEMPFDIGGVVKNTPKIIKAAKKLFKGSGGFREGWLFPDGFYTANGKHSHDMAAEKIFQEAGVKAVRPPRARRSLSFRGPVRDDDLPYEDLLHRGVVRGGVKAGHAYFQTSGKNITKPQLRVIQESIRQLGDKGASITMQQADDYKVFFPHQKGELMRYLNSITK